MSEATCNAEGLQDHEDGGHGDEDNDDNNSLEDLENDAERGLLLSQDFVRRGLSISKDPLAFIDSLQREHGSALVGCEPVFWLLEVLGMRRNELMRGLFQNLKGKLLTQVKSVTPAQLRSLLEETLPLLAHPTLEEIPLKILAATTEPSAAVLEQLSQLDSAALEKLPQHTRQVLWEEYPQTYMAHVEPIIDRFVHDSAATTWCDEMFPDVNFPQPHKRRQKSTPLQELIRSIGSSAKLYRFITDRVRELFAESGNLRLCALRADLLMGLHDINAQQTVLATEPCHDFAWHLDAYVKKICIHVARASLDINVATLQRTVVNELTKILNGKHKPGLASAFASTSDIYSSANQVFANGPINTKAGGGGANPNQPRAPEKIVDLTTVLHEAWKKIRNLDRDRSFHHPVVVTYPQLKRAYEAVIKKPMDLQTIEDKIHQREYDSVDEMRADLHLIADNAIAFNGMNHKIAKSARSIMKNKSERYLNAAAQKLQNATLHQRAIEEAQRKEEERKAKEEEEARKEKAKEEAAVAAAAAANGKSMSAEEIERKRAREEDERREKIKQELQAKFAFVESSSRNRRTISDAAMILASGFTVNALTNILWFLIGEDVVRREQLPRDSDMTKNIAWLLQVGSRAHQLVREASQHELTVEPLKPDAERRTLPALALIMSEAVEFRLKASPAGGGDSSSIDAHRLKDLIDPCISDSLKTDWFTRNAVLHFYCQRICHRDVAVLPLIQDLIKKQGAIVAEHPAFLHSLVTSFFIQSQRQNTTSGPAYQSFASRPGPNARVVTHHVSGTGQQAPLPASSLTYAIESLFLPEVLRVAPRDTDPTKTAWAHVHLTRLLSLEYALHTLSQSEVLKFARAALISLSGSANDMEPTTIMASPELKDIIYERYCSPTFERARRQYEKIFRRMPTMRTQCGLPPLIGSQDNQIGPSPSPSPSPFVSPSPSPYAPSPFVANSPAAEPMSGAASTGGASPLASRKRPLDQAMEGVEETLKRSKTGPL